MWKIFFGMTSEKWQQMKFSHRSIKKFRNMKKMLYDQRFVSFLERCGVDEYQNLAIAFSDVYGSFEEFLSEIQGKIVLMQNEM